MTDFKPGDRVKVEFEADVISVKPDNVFDLELQADGVGVFYCQSSSATKIAPQPQPGDVWRLEGTVWVATATPDGGALTLHSVQNSRWVDGSLADFSSAELLFRLPKEDLSDSTARVSRRLVLVPEQPQEQFLDGMRAAGSAEDAIDRARGGPRQPRVFNYGDPGPGPEVKRIRDNDDDTWVQVSPGLWADVMSPGSTAHGWVNLRQHWFPMTEVIEGDDE